jgi:hypothetical protein
MEALHSTETSVHTYGVTTQRFAWAYGYIVGVYVTGQEVEVKRLSVRGLLPDTEHYMTYDGSTTMPACHETVTWVILNKPIYITKQQVGNAQYNCTVCQT